MGNRLSANEPVMDLSSLAESKIRIKYIEPSYFLSGEDDLYETATQIHVYGSNGEHYQNFLYNPASEIITGEQIPNNDFEVATIMCEKGIEFQPGYCWGHKQTEKYTYTFYLNDKTFYKINVPLYKA